MKIDWAKKLSSRKFWAMVAAFAQSTITAFGGTESTAVRVASIIVGGGAIIAYILTEGKVDAASAANASKPTYDAPTATADAGNEETD